MSISVPTREPTSARAGDTWAWTLDLADYPAYTYALTYTLFSASGVISFSASASGATHSVSLPPETTAAYAAGRYDWIAQVSDGTNRLEVGRGSLTILPNISAPATAATLSTGSIAANNALTWTATSAGTASNAVRVSIIDPDAVYGALSVAVGVLIRCTLATDGDGAITTTASELLAAVNESAAAAALVTVSLPDGCDGSGVVDPVAISYLSGGAAAPYATYDGRSHARKMLDAINAMLEGRATDGDLDVVRTATGDRSTQYDMPTLIKLRQQYTAAVAAEDAASGALLGKTSGRVQMRF